MKTKKYVEVKAYLEPEKDKALIDTLQRIADNSNMSMSAVCGFILRYGAANVEKALTVALKSGEGKKVPSLSVRKRAVQK